MPKWFGITKKQPSSDKSYTATAVVHDGRFERYKGEHMSSRDIVIVGEPTTKQLQSFATLAKAEMELGVQPKESGWGSAYEIMLKIVLALEKSSKVADVLKDNEAIMVFMLNAPDQNFRELSYFLDLLNGDGTNGTYSVDDKLKSTLARWIVQAEQAGEIRDRTKNGPASSDPKPAT